jgi:hypothetical protein
MTAECTVVGRLRSCRYTTCTVWSCLLHVFVSEKATFNNISAISWRSVLLVEETGIPAEKLQHVASY